MKLSAPHSSAAIKNQWNYNTIPTYVLVVNKGALSGAPLSREEHLSTSSCPSVRPSTSITAAPT